MENHGKGIIKIKGKEKNVFEEYNKNKTTQMSFENTRPMASSSHKHENPICPTYGGSTSTLRGPVKMRSQRMKRQMKLTKLIYFAYE